MRRARDELLRHERGTFIDFRAKLPLSAALSVGAAFPEVGGYCFRVEQPIAGEIFLWRSDEKPSSARFAVDEIPCSDSGTEVLVAFFITGDGTVELRNLLDSLPGVRAAIIARPQAGPSSAAIASAADAASLAQRAKELIRDFRLKHGAQSVHLVLYAPSAFCLFLGQKLNALGDIHTYDRSATGAYVRSVTVRSG